jgi:hypothetical protein
MPADMNKLAKLKAASDRIGKRLNLDIEQISGFGDGTYLIEFKEPEKKQAPIGFGRK